MGSRKGPPGVRPGRAHRVPAPPRRARRAEHRPDARPAGHGARKARRRELRRRTRAVPRGALDPLVGERPPRRGHEPPDPAPGRRRRDRGGAVRAQVPRPPECVPADQHGHGRAALRPRTRVRAADRRGERLRPLLRDRHDRAHAGPRRADRVGRRGLRGVGRVRARERGAERDRERGLLRGRGRGVAGRSPRARRSAGRGRRRPAAGRSLGQGAPSAGAPRAETRSSTCPATRRLSPET